MLGMPARILTLHHAILQLRGAAFRPAHLSLDILHTDRVAQGHALSKPAFWPVQAPLLCRPLSDFS